MMHHRASIPDSPQWERGYPHTLPQGERGYPHTLPIVGEGIPHTLPTVGQGIHPYTPHSGTGVTPIHSPQWERGYPHTLPIVGEGIPPYTPHSGRGDTPIQSSTNTFNVCRNHHRQSSSRLCHNIITLTYGWKLASLIMPLSGTRKIR